MDYTEVKHISDGHKCFIFTDVYQAHEHVLLCYNRGGGYEEKEKNRNFFINEYYFYFYQYKEKII